MPGEYIQLKIACKGHNDNEITVKRWDITAGIPFKTYSADNNTGEKIGLTSTDYKQFQLNFCFAQPTNSVTISCTFLLNGRKCSVKGTMAIDDLIVKYGSTDQNGAPIFKGTTKLNAAKDAVGIYPAGIQLVAEVRVPPTYNEGEWNLTQVTIPNRTAKIGANSCVSRLRGNYVLDTSYPYTGPFATGPIFHGTQDTPEQGLSDQIERQGNDKFAMIVMFRPAGVNSQYVPLAETNWSWTYCCHNNAGWVLVSGGRSADPWQRSTLFPVWTENVVNVKSVAVPCPPPCQ